MWLFVVTDETFPFTGVTLSSQVSHCCSLFALCHLIDLTIAHRDASSGHRCQTADSGGSILSHVSFCHSLGLLCVFSGVPLLLTMVASLCHWYSAIAHWGVLCYYKCPSALHCGHSTSSKECHCCFWNGSVLSQLSYIYSQGMLYVILDFPLELTGVASCYSRCFITTYLVALCHPKCLTTAHRCGFMSFQISFCCTLGWLNKVPFVQLLCPR